MTTSVPPPYSQLPPRYSQVVDQNPSRYAVSNGRVWQVVQPATNPSQQPGANFVVQPQPMPANQATFLRQPAPCPHACTQLVQYQQPCIPSPYLYNYSYPPSINSVQAYPVPPPFFQQPQPLPPLQPIFYQGPPPVLPVVSIGPVEFEITPPPPGYVLIPGTNYAVPKEWISKEFKKLNTKKDCAKVLLPVLYGLKAMLV